MRQRPIWATIDVEQRNRPRLQPDVLLGRIQGDPGGLMEADEFDAFYTTSFSRVVHQLHAMIGDRQEAQDCVQEAFVRAWCQRRRLDRAGSPAAWVRLTAYRLAVSHWRRTVRSRRSPDRALQPVDDQPPPDEARDAVFEEYFPLEKDGGP